MLVNESLELNISFSVAVSDGRHVTFSGPISPLNVMQWFEQAGRAVASIFGVNHAVRLTIVAYNSQFKIPAIKVIREITMNNSIPVPAGLGLKEAKDFIEGKSMDIIDPRVLAEISQRLEPFGCKFTIDKIISRLPGITIT